ncbi:MAG: type II secretion system F family protein [Candidatus Omnitrophota bacterium]
MTRFIYSVRDKSGKKISGYEEASSQEELISRLQNKDLLVISVMPAEGKAADSAGLKTSEKTKSSIKHQGITNEDLTLFCRQLATLLSAGVTMLKCLDIIAQQVASRKLFDVIKELQRLMEGGLSLHEAMAKHPKVFSELWVNLVESGEASGNLALVLGRLAGTLERMEAFKKKVGSALIYPLILFLAGSGALLFLTIKIIPTFAELFKGFNLKLPFLTRVLVYVSEVIRKYFFVGIIGIGAAVFIFKKYTSTKNGKLRYEQFLFSLPVLGEFFRVLVMERFSSEMSTLVESGVPILYSLEIAEHSVDNLVVAEIIHHVKDDVRDGKPLHSSLNKSGFFDPMTIQMISIGEEIGELPQMFKRINTFYQEAAETFLTRFTAMFEPIMLIFMGLVIGLMVVGMFLPMFQLTKIH